MKKIIAAPYIDQTERWVYGCESVSSVMLLQYFGFVIDPDVFIDTFLPRATSREENGVMYADDPANYYINNPRDLTGWGCYAPCIVNALTAVLRAEDAREQYQVCDETGKTAQQLCEEYIKKGLPVIFWATLDFLPVPEETPPEWILPSGERFVWRSNEHCLLLVGYDDEHFYFNDPWHNHGCVAHPKALVEARHQAQGMYAVALKPLLPQE